jgi:hypothetical protein
MQRLVARRPAIPVLEHPVPADLVAHLEAVKGNPLVRKGLGSGETGTTGTDDADFG